MKKIFIGVLVLMAVVLQGCSSANKMTDAKTNSNSHVAVSSSSSSVSIPKEAKYSNGYLFANGNYKQDTGKKIYITGTLKDTAVTDKKVYGLIEEPQTKKNWMMYLCDEKDCPKNFLGNLVGKSVSLYGVSKGINAAENFPVISTDKITVDKTDYTLSEFLKAGESGKFKKASASSKTKTAK